MEKPDSRTASISPGSQPARMLKVNMVKYVAMLYCEAGSDTLNETLPALQLDDILLLAKEDAMGKALQAGFPPLDLMLR